MGIFSRDREDDVAVAPPQAPHPALASPEAFRDASLADAAAAVLVLGFDGAEPWHDVPRFRLAVGAHELWEPLTGLKGAKLLGYLQDRQFELVLSEAIGVLARSLLVHVTHMGDGQSPILTLTRRGAQALESGAPERWMDVPAAP